MLNFKAKIYTPEEAFFETLKNLYEDNDSMQSAIAAFTGYLNARSKDDNSELDFMTSWLEDNNHLSVFCRISSEERKIFGLDDSFWYVNTYEQKDAK